MKEKIKKLILKKNKSKIVCLTAYSKNISKILDRHCDLVLVGDSMANVLYGFKNTHKLTLDNIIQHTLSVQIGIKKSLLVVDMPKNSYSNLTKALQSAKLIMRLTKCDAVKLESNKKNYNIIKKLVKKDIPVMGHIGYTPQFKKKFKVEGDTKAKANLLLYEALRIEKAGAFSIVLECIAPQASKLITKKLKIPTIGIGSSSYCDGQILVTDDMLGISGFYPKFVKKYANLNRVIEKAVKKYTRDVKERKFPKIKNFLNGTKSK
ncbi:3-methyl-2-oxobutanoate hydroxymethyltransferase [Pelagibacteraceae bacterium]|jgi:3-methyl-2-oxobutanoate hydroxymethyltransferase|nr:3-methyl-2-oxobutanoate hydroxymethyltransferase [Pelagibacteraceae bacterium]